MFASTFADVSFIWLMYWSNRNCSGVQICQGQMYAKVVGATLVFKVRINVIISACLFVVSDKPEKYRDLSVC